MFIWSAKFGNDPDSDLYVISYFAPHLLMLAQYSSKSYDAFMVKVDTWVTKMMASNKKTDEEAAEETSRECDPLLADPSSVGSSSSSVPPAGPFSSSSMATLPDQSDHIIFPTEDSAVNLPDDKREDEAEIADILGHAFFMVLLCLVVGVPIFHISVHYGWWTIVSRKVSTEIHFANCINLR
jgi:hypothetical protein